MCDAGDPDRDGDGVPNESDQAPLNRNLCHDLDGDGCDECITGTVAGTDTDGSDADGDGMCDDGDLDTDGDGAPNGQDTHPDNPELCHDADNDGCDECATGTRVLPENDGLDFDNDGICDAGSAVEEPASSCDPVGSPSAAFMDATGSVLD